MTHRVAVGMFAHETNVFSPIATTLQAWREKCLVWGPELLPRFQGTGTVLGGFLDVAREEGWEVVPALAAAATPSGPTPPDVYEDLRRRLLDPILRQGPDAVLLHLHGAMVTGKGAPAAADPAAVREGLVDPEGELARAVKAAIGSRPLVLVLDLHANVTADMCAACDGVFGYDTDPHIDHHERGLEAGRHLARLLDGEAVSVVEYLHPPMMPPTINMRTAEGPMAELLELARSWEERPGIVNVSVFGGFPCSDVPQAGLSVVTTAAADRAAVARECCRAIAGRAWALRSQFLKRLPGPAEALDRAAALLAEPDDRPVVLADASDNPGGGASGDTTGLLGELLDRDLPGAVAAAIWDPETVDRAVALGVGGEGEFSVGGKAEPAYGPPLVVWGRVRALTDGRFAATGPMGRGAVWDMGRAAVIEAGRTRLVVCSTRITCNDADLIRSVGIQPERARLLLVKSRGHFRASFEPFCRAIIEVDAPGAVNSDVTRYDYRRVARPVWPLDEAARWPEG